MRCVCAAVQRHAASAAARLMRRRERASVFMRWRRALSGAAAMRLGLVRMLQRALSRGWRGWRTQRQAAVRAREGARRGRRHLVQRRLRAGWAAWSETVAVRRGAVELMRRSLPPSMARRRLATATVRWAAEAQRLAAARPSTRASHMPHAAAKCRHPQWSAAKARLAREWPHVVARRTHSV